MALELNGAPPEVTGPILGALGGAAKSTSNTFPAKQVFGAGVELTGRTLADAATVQWDLAAGGFAAVSIAGNRVLQLVNVIPGVHRLRVTQGAGGAHTLTFDAGLTVRTPGGAPVTLSTAVGAVDWLTIICHGGTTIDVLVDADFQAL